MLYHIIIRCFSSLPDFFIVPVEIYLLICKSIKSHDLFVSIKAPFRPNLSLFCCRTTKETSKRRAECLKKLEDMCLCYIWGVHWVMFSEDIWISENKHEPPNNWICLAESLTLPILGTKKVGRWSGATSMAISKSGLWAWKTKCYLLCCHGSTSKWMTWHTLGKQMKKLMYFMFVFQLVGWFLRRKPTTFSLWWLPSCQHGPAILSPSSSMQTELGMVERSKTCSILSLFCFTYANKVFTNQLTRCHPFQNFDDDKF